MYQRRGADDPDPDLVQLVPSDIGSPRGLKKESGFIQDAAVRLNTDEVVVQVGIVPHHVTGQI